MHRIISNLQWYFKVVFAFATINLLARLFDFLLIRLHQAENLMSFFELFKALFLDFMLSFSFAGLLLVVFIILSIINKYVARIISALLFVIIIIANIGLVLYFDYTKVPLDQVVFIYNFTSIIKIISITGGTSLANIYPIIIGVILFIFSIFISNKVKIPIVFVNTGLLFMIFAAASTNIYIYRPTQFHNDQSFYCNQNKIIYFVKASVNFYNKKDKPISKIVIEDVIKYQNADPSKKIYLSRMFPFNQFIESKSNLEKYFKAIPEGEKPNVVFIIVESLCHELSGKYTPNYSFTPFLDSLTQQSLYWRNALSSSERTFGVLPTVLASLPPGRTGFLDQYKLFPNFNALSKSLKNNNYSTQMFYGGWSAFTEMDKFVYKSGIDSIYDKWPESIKMPEVNDNFTWGYGDEVLFDKSFDYLDSVISPYFSLYLTLSTHSPFSINNQEIYVDKVKNILGDIKDDKTRDYVVMHINDVSTFFMFDEQLGLFFEKYRRRDDFHKTIFVITGDHKSILFPNTNNLSKYYVPLIIYSPLLKQSKEFGALVSHYDIAPSIAKLLKVKYKLNMPNFSQYLGKDLDTNINFVSNQRLFFMRNSRVVDEYLYRDNFLAGDKLFKVNDFMQLIPIHDEVLRDKMKRELDEYMDLQIYSIEYDILTNRMIDTLYN